MSEPTPLAAFAALDMPVLYMVGDVRQRRRKASRGCSTAVLPRVEVMEFDDLGHMGPVTHPEVVNDAIARFFDRA